MATLSFLTPTAWMRRLSLAGVSASAAPSLPHPLATPHQQRHNAPVLFNSGTGIGVPNDMADSRLAAIFTSVFNTIGAPFSMAGRGGSVLARAGFHIAGTPIPPRACHPRLASGGRSLSDMEAAMPSFTLRVARALFPVFSVPVSTVATHAQACAMARLLVSQGKRVAIVPAAQGFTVSEVQA